MKTNQHRLAKLLALPAIAFAGLFVMPPAPAQQESAQQEGPSMADLNEIKDTLERSKTRGKLIACADPYDWPYSSNGEEPPGFDIDIIRNIAKRGGMRLEMYWADTGTRGGIMRAFRNSILAKRCDVFLGLSDNGEEDLLPRSLTFTDPYISLGYVLVVQGKAVGMRSLDEFKKAGMKVGVPMSTPIDDYLFTHQVPRELYLNNQRIMEGMSKGEVDASMVWATAVAVAKVEFPDAKFHMVEGYVPIQGHRFNSKFAVRKEDKSLLQFINEGIKELLASGKVKQIVESYGVPFYAPLS
jgi:ABC-type amino acid transport substrate-binding protein